jgi:hypothetical protein
MFGFNTKLSEDYAILMMAKKLGLIPFVQEFMPVLDTTSQIPEDYFDMDLDLINSLSVGSDAYFYIDFQGEFFYGFSPTKQALITPLYSISLRRKPL